MQKPFKVLSGDVSGFPSILYRATNSAHTEYDVIELNHWADLDSSAIETHGKYNVQSGTVALDNPDANARALRSWGFSMAANGDIEDEQGNTIVPADKVLLLNRVLLECLWSYGAKDVATDISGNNIRKLVKQAKAAL